MATSLFDLAPEYDSDLDTLADFVLEPTTTTAHVPPPPSPAPNTCLCGNPTCEDESDDHLYCSQDCARLDAIHALTARSRSNSLAPTPVTTAPTTPLGMHTPLRESLAILFAPNDSTSTPPYAPTPLSASSSHASFELPIEMSSHYRRVHAKRERMERRASEERERSRSHSRSHSKASPSLSSLREEIHVETIVEREAGSDGEDHVPEPAALFVHVAVDVQVEHHTRDEQDSDDAMTETSDPVLPSLGPAPGLEWHNPFADPSPSSPLSSHDLSVAPHDGADPCRETDDVLSITESELSPFIAYAPVPGPPPGLRTRKSSVCFAGVDPAAGRITRSRASSVVKSRSRAASLAVFAEKPLPPTPGHDATVERLRSLDVSESEPSMIIETQELVNPLPSPALTMDSPFQPASASLESAEPTTPTSSTAPASPCTPNARIQAPEDGVDPLATPSRSSSVPATRVSNSPVTVKHSPPASVPRTHKPQALDTLARAKIFSMVIDPELDVFSAEVVNQVAPAPALKRSETAPELTMGWGVDAKPAVLAQRPQTPRKENRARATSTPRRGAASGRPRTTSTPLLGPLQLTSRRGRVQHIPPPTPPVSPAQVSSPRPVVGQDPGSWPSFGAVYEAWGHPGEMHRRQESGESTASSATDVSWGSADTTEYWRGRAQSPATSSVRTVVPPPRGSSLVRYDADDKDQLHIPRRTRRHSSIAALDSILAMEDTFWATEGPVVVREADDGEGEGVPAGQFSTKPGLSVSVGQFSGDAGGFAFPSEKPKPAFEPVLRIAGVSSSPARSRRSSGVRFDSLVDHHGHRLPPSQFPVTPSVGEPSPIPAHLHLAGSLFDGPVTASPLLLSARGSPALPNASPISAHFGLRAPSSLGGSPYLSVGRRGSRSTDASSVLMRTASAARLAAALNAAPENDDDDDELAR
ncbi:hypothetical protein FRC07_004099, partial [Ceratobasidium sp. 392]